MSETAYHQFKLRMPKELFDSLSAASDESKRSVSAEIISRLEASFDPHKNTGLVATAEFRDAFQQQAIDSAVKAATEAQQERIAEATRAAAQRYAEEIATKLFGKLADTLHVSEEWKPAVTRREALRAIEEKSTADVPRKKRTK